MTGIRTPAVTLAAYGLSADFSPLSAGLYVSMVTLTGDPNIGPAYTLNSIAAAVIGGVALSGGVGSPLGAALGAFILRTISSLDVFFGPAAARSALLRGGDSRNRDHCRRARHIARTIPPGALYLMPVETTSQMPATKTLRPKIERPVILVCIACVAIVLGAGAVSPGILSAGYLLQQLQIAAIVGILASGAMLVILLGEIDLSIPLTVTGTAILSTSLAGSGNAFLESIAIPAGLRQA